MAEGDQPAAGAVVLVVDDEPGMRATIEAILAAAGIATRCAPTARAALDLQASTGPGVAIVDYRLPDGSGIELAAELKGADPDIAVVALTGHASLESAIAAVGVVDRYLTKPVDPEILVGTVRDRLERRALIGENRRLLQELRTANAQLEARVEQRTRQLSESEERFWAFVELSPGAVLIVDAGGSIVVANPGAEELFGPDTGPLAGTAIDALLDAGEGSSLDLLAVASRSPTRALDLTARRRDGRSFPASLMVRPLTEEPDGTLAVTVRDDTARQRVEDSLRQAYEQEREAARLLREADRAKDEFLATVSHELRTPLTAITGFTALLLERADLDPTVRGDLLRRVSTNAAGIRRMIERLLDFAKLEGSRVELHPAPAGVAGLVAACLDAHAAELELHQVTVEVEEDLDVVVDTDGFGHILGNLLSNAAKFAPAGSEIAVRATRRDGRAVISVDDRGPGIAPAEQSAVFERFYQVRAEEPGRRGTGVGLAIAARYVDLHGGEIWVDSIPGAGATFSFSVPLAGVGPGP